MPLPRSFASAGLVTPEEARKKSGSRFRGLMLATEGRADTGKTEFILSCPGPGAVHCVDRGFHSVFDNPNPPKTRRNDFGFNVVLGPNSAQGNDPDTYLPHWNNFRKAVYATLDLAEVRTCAIDGDSVSWEIQRLAEHGKLTGVYPATKYTNVKAARRLFYHRLYDSGKIIITTNMLTEEWDTVTDRNGLPVMDPSGEPKREPSGRYRAQGFPDQEYLWQIRIRHLFEPATWNKVLKRDIPKRWGLEILKCKANVDLVGSTLWGKDCNFAGLMSLVYPQVPLSEWGL